MDKLWAYIIDAAIAGLIIFFAVAIYFGLRTETVMKSIGKSVTEDFMTEVKRNGCITVADYEEYMGELFFTDSLYDINMEHIHSVFEPEYRFRTIEEIIEAQNAAYTGTNVYHYREVETEAPVVNDPVNNGNLNTETNESVFAKATNNPASSSHVHTEECYAGHKHTGSKSFIHTHKHTSSCRIFDAGVWYFGICPRCGNEQVIRFDGYYWDDASNSVMHGDWWMSLDCLKCGQKDIGIKSNKVSKGYSCGYNKDLNGDGYNDVSNTTDTYEYIKSYPQRTDIRFTVTSGCYRYHQHVAFPAGWNYPGQYYYYSTEHFMAAVRNGINAYCSAPTSYTIRWSANEGSSSYNCTYGLVVNADGTLSFNFISGYGNVIGDQRSYWPKFPQSVTWEWLANLSSPYKAYALFSQVYNFGGSDGSNFSNNFHLDFQASGGISFCSEPATYNQWYTTCGQVENGTLACSQIIQSLTPTHPVQTVATGDPLITTAIATYRDGSTKTIECTSTFDTSSITENQNVTLTYTSVINGIQYHNSCAITVTVVPRTKTCSNGHMYNLRADGSDPGCPYCKEWIRDLRIIYPNISNMTITIGTTLPDNGVTLLATYFDGHTETVSSGYIDNLDSQYFGTKLVTIGYKGKTVQLMITTVCTKMICDICGFEYDLYPDGTNPGCPRCIQKTPVFTGNVIRYDEAVYTEEILNKLYTDGEYRFNLDDTFTISVNNMSNNIARNFLNKLFPSLSDRWFSLSESEKIGMR